MHCFCPLLKNARNLARPERRSKLICGACYHDDVVEIKKIADGLLFRTRRPIDLASTVGKNSCVKCTKSAGQVTCGGCNQWFCVKHLLEHRQELSQQMDALTLEHDQLQQNLTEKTTDQPHPLVVRVDRWESKSLRRIQQVVDEIRSNLRKPLGEMKRNIGESLHQMMQELKESRPMETFTEIDIQKWMNQLKQLREQLENPSTMELIGDEDERALPHIPLIQLQASQQRKGKGN